MTGFRGGGPIKPSLQIYVVRCAGSIMSFMGTSFYIAHYCGSCGVLYLIFMVEVIRWRLCSWLDIGVLGGSKDAQILWQCAVLGTLWCIWIERNTRFFRDQVLTFSCLWERISFYTSFSASILGVLKGVSITDLSRDWRRFFIGFYRFPFLLSLVVVFPFRFYSVLIGDGCLLVFFKYFLFLI